MITKHKAKKRLILLRGNTCLIRVLIWQREVTNGARHHCLCSILMKQDGSGRHKFLNIASLCLTHIDEGKE